MYVVRGESREGGGAVVVTRMARVDALAAAIDFLDQGIPSVTIIGDSRYGCGICPNPWLKNMPRGPEGEKRPAAAIEKRPARAGESEAAGERISGLIVLLS
jgi:hypothetical protein